MPTAVENEQDKAVIPEPEVTLTEQETTDFTNDISEYQQTEKKVAEGFVQGLIVLGEVLKRQRDKWKPKRLWGSYLEKIGKNLVGANQLIRIYDLAQEDIKLLMDSNITNWKKLNAFLALSEEDREKLAEEIQGEELSNSEFYEKVDDLSVEDPGKVETVEIDDGTLNVSSMVNTSSLVNLNYMAKQVLKELNKESGVNFSVRCLPVVESFLATEKILRDLSQETLAKLTVEEKQFWFKQLKTQTTKLEQLVNAVQT